MRGDSERGGDRGMTSLGDGSRVRKDSARVDAYGGVDELDAVTGLALAETMESVPAGPDRDLVADALAAVQHSCWVLGASLADPATDRKTELSDALCRVEGVATAICGKIAPARQFVAPGASVVEARIHVARTVCRRAERNVVALGADAADSIEIRLLNRISGLLFDAARLVLVCQGLEPLVHGRDTLKSR